MNNRAEKILYSVITLPLLFLLLSVFTGCAARRSGTEHVSYMHVRALMAREAGIKAFTSNKPSLALKSFGLALKTDRALDDKESEVLDLINIARASIALDDFTGAESYLNSAVKTGIGAGNGQYLGAAYATLAKVESLTGRQARALSHIKESIRVDEKSGIKNGGALNLLGSILIEAGRTDEARFAFESALKVNIDNNDKLEEANSYRFLGRHYSTNKNYDESARFYGLAYGLDTKAGNSEKISLDLTSLAVILIKQGLFSKAAYQLERSYTVNLNNGRYLEAIANLTLLIDTFDRLGYTAKVDYFARLKGSLIRSYEENKAQHRTESE